MLTDEERRKRFGPSFGEPGYLPYCGRCTGFYRMVRETHAFKCRICGLETTRINGQEMFDQTAPETPHAD